MQGEIQAVTGETRQVAVELFAQFFREEGFATPPSRIAENLDRMLADPSCWCALAVKGGATQAVITVSTVLYVESGRLGEIGDLYVLPEHRGRGLARRLVEHAKAWCRGQGCSAVSVTITPGGRASASAQQMARPVYLQHRTYLVTAGTPGCAIFDGSRPSVTSPVCLRC